MTVSADPATRSTSKLFRNITVNTQITMVECIESSQIPPFIFVGRVKRIGDSVAGPFPGGPGVEWLVHRKQADVPVDKRDGGSGLSGGGMPWVRPPNVGGRRARRRHEVGGEGRFTSVGNTGVGDSDRRCRFTDAGERLPVEVGIDSVARFAIDPFIGGAMPDLVIGGIAV